MTRLPMATIEDLHRQLAGDPVTEERVLRYIRHKFDAVNLSMLSKRTSEAILERPQDFLRACKEFQMEGQKQCK